MFEVKKSEFKEFEGLMRELNKIESSLMGENRELAMELMVVEAKIRDRFEHIEKQYLERPFFNDSVDQLSPADVQALIPYDLPEIKRIRIVETVTVAGVLAVMTALGIFGLVSLLQLVLSWFA